MKTQIKFWLLWIWVAAGLSACSHYRKLSSSPANILDQYQVYVISKEFGREQGWKIALSELSETEVAGKASRLNKQELSNLVDEKLPIGSTENKYKIIILSITNQQAETIPDYGQVRLALKDVVSIQTFDYYSRRSESGSAGLFIFLLIVTPIIVISLF